MMVKLFFSRWITIAGLIVFTGGVTHADPVLELSPPQVVVRYGDSVSVNCSTSSTDFDGMGWEASQGGTDFETDVSFVTWTVKNLTEWNTEPKCYITLANGDQPIVILPVTLYRLPDSVSISLMNHTGPMVEDTEYQLVCDVFNVAPTQNLTMTYYKEDEIIRRFTYGDGTTPADMSFARAVIPSRHDDGAQYRCEARLDLGPYGPQPPPAVTSAPLNATVHYKPTFLSTDPETHDLAAGEEVTLNCSVSGNPVPVYRWQSSQPQENLGDQPLLTFSSLLSGTYNCTASNVYGETTKQFIINIEVRGDRSTFWGIIGAGVAVALLTCSAYAIIKMRSGPNSII